MKIVVASRKGLCDSGAMKTETDISAKEWTNGKDILRFEVGPHTTITVKVGAI